MGAPGLLLMILTTLCCAVVGAMVAVIADAARNGAEFRESMRDRRDKRGKNSP